MCVTKLMPLLMLVVGLFAMNIVVNAQESLVPQQPAELRPAEVAGLKSVHQSGNLIFSGQFTPDDIQSMKGSGIERVISLRRETETDFDESKLVTGADLKFERVPFASEESLTDDVFDKVRGLLRDDSQKTLLHCGSANRVGGVWLTYRVLDQGVDVDKALAEAKKIGLRAAFVQRKALDYIKRQTGPGDSKAAPVTPAAKAEGNADVTFVKATTRGNNKWTFHVTVSHPDVGWKDFANGWDVVLPNGKAILLNPKDKFTRVLGHPHVNERPFTRSQANIPIPAETKTVTVRAHDLVTGYGGKVIEVNLNDNAGNGFEVVR